MAAMKVYYTADGGFRFTVTGVAPEEVKCVLVSGSAAKTGNAGEKAALVSGAALTINDAVIFTDPKLILNLLVKINSDPLFTPPEDNVTAVQLDFWKDFAHNLLSRKQDLPVHLGKLNQHLANNTYVLGAKYGLADVVVYGILKGNPRYKPTVRADAKRVSTQHVQRWFNSVDTSSAIGILANGALAAKAKARYEQSKSGSFNIQLVGAEEGQVVTRFPPEPSGFLHIGHVKAVLLNDYFAKKYKGKMILRFDDTNPSKEKQEYVDSIIHDLKTLGVEWAVLTHTSDHFDWLLSEVTKLIKRGLAYIDETPYDTMRDEKKAGIPSRYRDRPVNESLEKFLEMQAGTPEGIQWCLRGKFPDISTGNKTLFDPVFYRCNVDTPHVRTGTKYKVYPTYDYACPLVDSKEGVTHTLRTVEYRDRNAQFNTILDMVNLRKPAIWDYSRLNFQYTVLSKRKLKWFVEQGIVEGWNDPRFPTVQGIIRRGMTVDALREFMILQGASKNMAYMSWQKIWSVNKKKIEQKSHRYTAISAANNVPVTLTNFSEVVEATRKTIPLHPKFPEFGSKDLNAYSTVAIEHEDAVMCAVGEEVTLIGWGNAIINDIKKDETTGKVVSISATVNLAGSVKTTKKKLTWLPHAKPAAANVEVLIKEYDTLIDVKVLAPEMEFTDHLTKQSEFKTVLVGEAAIANVKEHEIIQIYRRGFFRCDVPLSKGKLTFIKVPDSKMSNSSILSSKVANK